MRGKKQVDIVFGSQDTVGQVRMRRLAARGRNRRRIDYRAAIEFA